MADITKALVVTQEMEEAGFRILEASGLADVYLEGDKLLLAEIYRAMSAVRPRPCDQSNAISAEKEMHETSRTAETGNRICE